MKRHEALAPLSREHHEALILAQLLKKGVPAYKGLPTDTAGKISYARQLYADKLRRHFLDEEKILEIENSTTGVELKTYLLSLLNLSPDLQL